jgi:organic radical activating enzyme
MDNYPVNTPPAHSLDYLYRQDVPIVIFGAGFAGQVLFNLCSSVGIEVTCICDNNGDKSKLDLVDCEVIPASELVNRFSNACFIISAADIGDIVLQLSELGFENWLAGGLLLKGIDINEHACEGPLEFLEYSVSTCILCHESYLTPDKIFLRSVDLVITERCSLKCQDCSNLMQYYEAPINYESDSLIATVNSFLSEIDEVNEFRVIGGEPFMNKRIDLVLTHLSAQEKIKKVVIYTNGTIVPKGDTLNALMNEKIVLIVTDYDALSRNIDQLKQVLDENEITYYAAKAQNWTDCAAIGPQHRTTDQQKDVYKRCCAKNLFTILDGKFYRCPFSAHVDRLKAVPEDESDYVDISGFSINQENATSLKSNIRDFVFDKEQLSACDFCVGRFLEDPKITPGIQTSTPLSYKHQR